MALVLTIEPNTSWKRLQKSALSSLSLLSLLIPNIVKKQSKL